MGNLDNYDEESTPPEPLSEKERGFFNEVFREYSHIASENEELDMGARLTNSNLILMITE